MKVSFMWPWKIQTWQQCHAENGSRSSGGCPGGHREALWDAMTTRSPRPEEQASVLKQSIQKKASRTDAKDSSTHNICTRVKSRQNGKLMVMVYSVSPYVIQGMGHCVLEHKLDEEKCVRGPFVNIHLIKILSTVSYDYFQSLFLFFWSGNVICLIK